MVDITTAVGLFTSSHRPPHGVAAVTFDDGFASLHEYALPILSRYRIPATVFLVASMLDGEAHSIDWLDPPSPAPPMPLSIGQVLDMQEQGVQFGSHSYSHHDLTALSEEECLVDLRTSRELLEDVLHNHVPLLAYPLGRHNDRVRNAAQRAGYTCAFSLPGGKEFKGRYAIPRAGIYQGDGLRALQAKTSPWFFAVRNGRLFSLARHIAPRSPVAPS